MRFFAYPALLMLAALILLAGCGYGGSSTAARQADEIAAAKAYVQSIAKQNSLKIDAIRVIAVREHGDQAVVRVEVRYHPYLAIGKAVVERGPEATVTLAVHLSGSKWYPEYGAVQ